MALFDIADINPNPEIFPNPSKRKKCYFKEKHHTRWAPTSCKWRRKKLPL